ncbi:TIGR03943 family putative permease subunit [Microbacterium koreense]|uniref:TIGR03943 family putative permease subunit n=1 Tax=Microbacterium koreense TaxID=323761 RepID=A0ABW2ZNI3_9MICO
MGTRWLGVGLSSIIAVVTISLAVTGRLSLYINPESTWFAVGMSVVLLVGAVASFALPLGAEDDHGHDHGDSDAAHGHHRRTPLGLVATVTGGVVASGVVVATLFLPPATLSAELAMSRDVGAPPLFAGADVVTLAATGDTASFGVGEWSAVFATATNPDVFDGADITLTGFVTPNGDGFDLTRLVITHCVIDAQSASIPIPVDGAVPETGQWVTVEGTVHASPDGRLSIDAGTVELIDEPQDPYEY